MSFPDLPSFSPWFVANPGRREWRRRTIPYGRSRPRGSAGGKSPIYRQDSTVVMRRSERNGLDGADLVTTIHHLGTPPGSL